MKHKNSIYINAQLKGNSFSSGYTHLIEIHGSFHENVRNKEEYLLYYILDRFEFIVDTVALIFYLFHSIHEMDRESFTIGSFLRKCVR